MLAFSKATRMASRRIDVPREHLASAMLPNPKMRYDFETQEHIEESVKLVEVAKEIFGPLL